MHELNSDAERLTRDEERRLARSIRRGDRSALEEFHSTFGTPVYRFVHYRLGGRVDEVEEVVQDTFLAALESLPRFRHDAGLYTWLCGIAKNLIARRRRHQYRDRVASAIEAVEPEIEAMLADLEQELPEEALAREETQELVGATLATLPLNYQDVLVDKYYAAQPVDEIAARRGTTPKAVESTLGRARRAFRRAFELLAGTVAKGTR